MSTIALDRSKAPETKEFRGFFTINHQKETTKGHSIYYINNSNSPNAVKIELLIPYHNTPVNKALLHIYSSLLFEGTSEASASDIANFYATYGAFIDCAAGGDYININIYCLHKYAEKVVKYTLDIFYQATFPLPELERTQNRLIQQLSVNAGKTSYIASKSFINQLVGNHQSHYYNSLDEATVLQVSQEELRSYHEKMIYQPFVAFIAGHFNEKELLDCFKDKALQAKAVDSLSHNVATYTAFEQLDNWEEANQTSTRFGFHSISQHDPLYHDISICNTILGGYFGSRLMQNIREEKGWTYGISSTILHKKNFSYFQIGADITKGKISELRAEISHEIQQLKEHLVPTQELEKVKQYCVGSLSGAFNTVFDNSDRLKNVIIHNLPIEFYEDYVKRVINITPEEIKLAANTLFNKEISVVAIG